VHINKANTRTIRIEFTHTRSRNLVLLVWYNQRLSHCALNTCTSSNRSRLSNMGDSKGDFWG